jgi:hypothetical protein
MHSKYPFKFSTIKNKSTKCKLAISVHMSKHLCSASSEQKSIVTCDHENDEMVNLHLIVMKAIKFVY